MELQLLTSIEESWRDIPGFDGIYQASSFGRIRTVQGKTTSNARYKKRVWQSRILKQKWNRAAGYCVTLWKNGSPKTFLVARLVCAAFYGWSKLTVNHKDGNRLNNRLENLEWLSLKKNIQHGFINGLYHTQISCALINSSGNKYDFRSMAEASRFLSKNPGYISNCLKKNKVRVTDMAGNTYFLSRVTHDRENF